MKKILLGAAALLMIASCAQKTEAQKIQEYEEAMKAIVDQYKAEQIDSDTAEKNILDLSLNTIKKYSNDSVALKALMECYYMLDVPQLEEALSTIGQKFAENDFIVKMNQSVQSKKNTVEGCMFTDFTIVQDETDPEGSTVKFSDYVGKGKYVLVDFWASWCGPCRREVPNLISVYEKYAGDNFDVLSIAVWDKPEDSVAAAAELGIKWAEIINAQKIPTDIYGIDGIPHIMLIGPDGTIVKRNLRGEGIEAAVKEALGL